MVYENFLDGYVEVDPNSHISRTSSRATVSGLSRDEHAYVYKNKGVGHFSGDFEHFIDVQLSTGSIAYSQFVFWALWNALGSVDEVQSGRGLVVFFFLSGSDPRIYLREWYDGTPYNDSTVGLLSLNIPYYLTIKRTGSTFECKIYSDSDRTVLVDTLTLTLHSVESFRYIYPVQGLDDNNPTVVAYGFCENMELQDYVPKTVKFHLPMTRIMLRPRGWAKHTHAGIVGLRRPYVPFKVQRPAQGVET